MFMGKRSVGVLITDRRSMITRRPLRRVNRIPAADRPAISPVLRRFGGRRRSFGSWGAGVAVVAVVVAVAVMMTGKSRPASSAVQSNKPDITKITQAMLVDQSSFPSIASNTWKTAVRDKGTAATNHKNVDPAACRPIIETPAASQSATAGGDLTDGASMGVLLELTKSSIDWHALVGKCAKFKDGKSEQAIKVLQPPGLPDGATAFDISSPGDASANQHTAFIRGSYRGVLINAVCDYRGSSSDKSNDLAKVFKDQVAKLEAA